MVLDCVLSWFICSISWCHWYARLCAVYHGLFAVPLGGTGYLDCVLSVMDCLLFLLVALGI